MELNRDFNEFIECFAARDVRFLIVVNGRLRDLADVEDLGDI